MIQLLGVPLLICLALAAILGYLGIHVLKREIIFIDIALAQLAAVGAVVAELLFPAHGGGHSHGGSLAGFLFAFVFVLLAAGFYAFVRRRVTQIPIEAVIGVTYAITAAGALFLPGLSPRFHGHVRHMLTGTILFVEWTDLVVCAAAFAAVGGLFRLFRGPLKAISEDYDRAIREGLNVVLWDFVFYALCGLVITLAVRVAGVVVVFAFLIIPATISAVFSSSWRTRLLAAWAAGAVASVLGLLFAYRLDFSMGPSVAAFLGLELACTGAYALRPSRWTATTSVVCLAGAFLGLLFAGPIAGTQHVDEPGGRIHGSDDHAHEAHIHADDDQDFGLLIERASGDADALARLFHRAPDDEVKSDLVARALEADPRAGVRLALEFLGGDPPLFFRQVVVGKLREVTGKLFGFDVAEPFAAASNREAAARLASEYGLKLP